MRPHGATWFERAVGAADLAILPVVSQMEQISNSTSIYVLQERHATLIR
jgi:hypothetical protein